MICKTGVPSCPLHCSSLAQHIRMSNALVTGHNPGHIRLRTTNHYHNSVVHFVVTDQETQTVYIIGFMSSYFFMISIWLSVATLLCVFVTSDWFTQKPNNAFRILRTITIVLELQFMPMLLSCIDMCVDKPGNEECLHLCTVATTCHHDLAHFG